MTRFHQSNGGESVNTRDDLGDFQLVTPGNALVMLVVAFILAVVLYHFRHF